MTGNEIRKRFLDFFAAQGHEVVESSSLVPHDDPTLLFTNAGMVQFKRVFMGEEQRDIRRAVTCQRCVRAGGKHNDLENVGYTARHHTFFEMLGNFSFGDYFKEEAIRLAWKFLTRELGLPPEKLWVSVFREDDEAFALWEGIEGLPKGRIVRLGEADNFWAMGDTGPCGPCSEIHIDQGVEAGCGRPDCAVGCDCDRFLELWNLVFMQFNRAKDGAMTPLPKPSIDTGMGLERVAAVLQGRHNNFESDLFRPIIVRIEALSGRRYGADERDNVAMRVIADHARTTAFLVADGVLPSNEGRGYVLRRVLRRAIRFGRTLGLDRFLTEVSVVVVETMAAAYPHLRASRELLVKVTENEERRFGETLDHGLVLLDEEITRLQGHDGGARLSGEFIFRLYDTHGFPVDVVRDVALERGVTYDEAGFQVAMREQRERSKAARGDEDMSQLAAGVVELLHRDAETTFVGYERRQAESRVAGLLDQEGRLVESAGAGERVAVYCELTAFYAESGGQVGDTGVLEGPVGRVRVDNTRAVAAGLVLHEGEVIEGLVKNGDPLTLRVDESRRRAIAANHSATHLLHAAMKRILGNHVKQAGSLVQAERLRFDFTHFSAVTPEELRAIEDLVNERIRANALVHTELLDRETALNEGATALFGEKYGTEVRVVAMAEFSKELCGGIHVGATGEIGLFKIVSEGSVASGVRRIEAVSGGGALDWARGLSARGAEIAALLGGSTEGAADKIRGLLKRQKELERQVMELTERLAMSGLDGLLAEALEVEGIRLVAAVLHLDSPKTLREIGDRVRDRLDSGVVLLGGRFEDKAALVAIVTRDLVDRVKAGDLVRLAAAMVGGKGGGRPDMAQAGGPMADKLPETIKAAPDLLRQCLVSRGN